MRTKRRSDSEREDRRIGLVCINCAPLSIGKLVCAVGAEEEGTRLRWMLEGKERLGLRACQGRICRRVRGGKRANGWIFRRKSIEFGCNFPVLKPSLSSSDQRIL